MKLVQLIGNLPHLAIALTTLLLSGTVVSEPMVTLTVREGELDILIDQKPVGHYVWDEKRTSRPYFRQLQTPDGTLVSRNHPPDPVADANNADHPDFHPGAWLAFGDAAGQDYWRNKAKVCHITFLAPPRSGLGVGGFTVINAYEKAGEGPEALFMETCAYTIRATDSGYILIAESEFAPEDGPMAFGDQEEMGFGVRLATPLTVKHGGGFIRNSAGGEQEGGTWGQTADWCAGYGKSGDGWAGMAVMTSPDNFRPSWFHSRDYGLVVANPFGKKAMTAPKDDAVTKDSTEVKADGKLRIGFGVYVFSTAGEPDFEGMYRAYIDARREARN